MGDDPSERDMANSVVWYRLVGLCHPLHVECIHNTMRMSTNLIIFIFTAGMSAFIFCDLPWISEAITLSYRSVIKKYCIHH